MCELETDKVSVEVPAPAAGVLSKILAGDGVTVEAGGKLAVISAGEGATAAAPAAARVAATASPEITKDGMKNAPSAEKLMAEKGLSPDQVTGTGRDGRIMKEDVMKAAPATAAPAPAPAAPVAANQAAREERVKMTRLRQTIARRLKDSQNTAAMLTTYNEVDMTEVMALRNEYKDLFLKKHGVKLGFMSFFTKACNHALKEVPEVNAEIDGDHIVYKNYVNMGIAAGTPTGLVVPVVKDADSMSFRCDRTRNRSLGRPCPRWQTVHGRHARRLLHHLKRRRLRLAHVLAHPEPTTIGHPRHAQNPRPPHGDQRRSCDQTHDVSRPQLRPPHRRRQRRCDVPRARERSVGRSEKVVDGFVKWGTQNWSQLFLSFGFVFPRMVLSLIAVIVCRW